MQFHTFLAKMRQGKSVTLERLSQGLCSVSMLKRIESGERLPGKMLRDRLLARLGLANDGYEDFLETDEYELWKKRQRLLRAVEDKDIETAEKMICQYEQQEAKENEIELQFYLVMRAQIMQYQGAEQAKLKSVFGKALDCTISGKNVDQWKRSLFSGQEWNILLEYIRCGGNVGKIPMSAEETYQAAAYEILLSAIKESDMDSYCYVKIYAKTAYYLCLEWLKEPTQKSRYNRILQACGSAIEMLRSTKRMFYLCELLEIMERVWEEMKGEKDRENAVDGGNVVSSQVKSWRKILAELYQNSGVPEKMENCVYLYWQTQNRHLSEVVRRRRKMLGISMRELCDGICHEKTLRRLEYGMTKMQREIMEELLARLGVSSEYQRQGIVTDNYEALILYDAISKALNNRDTKAMSRMLPKLRAMLPMELKVNRQEIAFLESLYLWHAEKITKRECLFRLRGILENTVPLERLKHAKEEYLSAGEMIYLYNIADKSDGKEKAEFMKLLQDICGRLVSENGVSADISIYELIMDSVAGYQGNIGEYDCSNKLSDEIIKEDLTLRRMTMLHESIYNKLWNRMECSRRTGNAERKEFLNGELEKCIQLAELCKDTFSEKFYIEKQKEL